MTSSEKSDAEIVCLVDDDLSVLKSIERLLASDGLSVRGFNKPKEFLSHVQAHSVPVAILDIWMEEMSGLETPGAAFRALPWHARNYHHWARGSTRETNRPTDGCGRVFYQAF